MDSSYLSHVREAVDRIRADGFYKSERTLLSPQAPALELETGRRVLNFCANNYLGLADDARLIAAAKDGLDRHGFGMASVRFICGTQTVHKSLEPPLRRSCAPMTASSTAVASTRTAACSRRCSVKRTRSSATS